MADSWISKLVRRYSAPDPFEKDGVEASPFVRELVMDVHQALSKRDFLSALKRMHGPSVYAWDDAKMRAQVLQYHEKRCSTALSGVDVLEHRYVSARIEYTRIFYFSEQNNKDFHYLGLNVHHGDAGSQVLAYQFGVNFFDTGFK